MYRALRPLFVLACACLLLAVIAPAAAQDELYRDPSQPIEARIDDLLARMSLAEKIGQMTLVEKNSLRPDDVYDYYIGGVLSGGGGYPAPNTVESWAEMVASYQEAALDTPLGIPMIYGVDAVHGHNNVRGATIFPHNIGLGATRDPELLDQIGRATAEEMIATGIYWNYAPVVAVVQDARWGRTYESYGENTDLVTELASAYMHGLQGDHVGDPLGVLATPKHFLGDGGTTWNTSQFGANHNDRGDTRIDEAGLRALYLPPYARLVNEGALTIMVSYSSWNGTPMHAQSYLLNDVLKGELGFQGFVVSDWAGIDAVANLYYDAVVASVNAGVDMNMVPQEYERFIDAMTTAVENGDISMDRVDDAVRRILRAKFAVGLFEHPYGDDTLIPQVGSDEHRALARQAVSESLVLLKNDDALPISRDAATIFVGGTAADDIGIQSGGWTIEWQGRTGNITPGTTVLEGIEAAAGADTDVQYNRFGRFEDVTDANGSPVIADVGIAVVGETPYAEYEGDSATLALSNADLSLIERMRAQSEKLIVIVLSGRPVVVTDLLLEADAMVAAWLPGTEGAGVADVLYGDVPFTGTLPFTWMRSIDQIPFDFANLPTEGCDAPLFPYGYGLTYDDSTSPWLDLAVECAA